MCIVSMVFDEYGKKPIQPWIPATAPAVPFITYETYPWSEVKMRAEATDPLSIFEELVRVAARLDKSLGLPDCEDPAKAVWLEKVRAAVREHCAKETERRLETRGP